jgi:hypothetical protein
MRSLQIGFAERGFGNNKKNSVEQGRPSLRRERETFILVCEV